MQHATHCIRRMLNVHREYSLNVYLRYSHQSACYSMYTWNIQCTHRTLTVYMYDTRTGQLATQCVRRIPNVHVEYSLNVYVQYSHQSACCSMWVFYVCILIRTIWFYVPNATATSPRTQCEYFLCTFSYAHAYSTSPVQQLHPPRTQWEYFTYTSS